MARSVPDDFPALIRVRLQQACTTLIGEKDLGLAGHRLSGRLYVRDVKGMEIHASLASDPYLSQTLGSQGGKCLQIAFLNDLYRHEVEAGTLGDMP